VDVERNLACLLEWLYKKLAVQFAFPKLWYHDEDQGTYEPIQKRLGGRFP
jgi:hypothetical protein